MVLFLFQMLLELFVLFLYRHQVLPLEMLWLTLELLLLPTVIWKNKKNRRKKMKNMICSLLNIDKYIMELGL